MEVTDQAWEEVQRGVKVLSNSITLLRKQIYALEERLAENDEWRATQQAASLWWATRVTELLDRIDVLEGNKPNPSKKKYQSYE